MPHWHLGEENTGGGFNIYCGETRVAHTAEVSAANAFRGGIITSEEAKANAVLIVSAVNMFEQMQTALQDIVNPLAALRRDAEINGDRLSGMAYQIANDPAHLQRIARAALTMGTAGKSST